ncbi:MAG: aa3-type cytochrome c oxidase subunit IV [Alphaproteobacteria bacterium]|nr:aa3-type cytochrome c oxidase subunit IV [Alphaproteobacteria bacterium]
MADAAHDDYHRGEMNIHDQRSTYHGFMQATLWGSALTVMYVAMFTVAFAIGGGWLAGLAALAAIGVGIGLLTKMGPTWWALLILQVVVLGLGGLIIPAIVGLFG